MRLGTASGLAFSALAVLSIASIAGSVGCSSNESLKPPPVAAPAPPPPSAAPASTSEPAPSTPGAGMTSTKEDPQAAAATPDPADVRASNAFTLKLLAHAVKSEPSAKDAKGGKAAAGSATNTMISGTSLRQALGVAYLGARGETARQMASALSLPESADAAAAAARAETKAWEAARGKDAELTIANRLWVEKSAPLAPAFTKLAEGAYGAAPESLDFAKGPDAARKTINAWVAEKTKDKIKDLLAEGSIDARTRAVITNAIWFKGAWATPFPKGATKDEPFHVIAKAAAPPSIPMMHVTGSFRVAKAGGAQILELSYLGTTMSMLIVLPDDVSGDGQGTAKLVESLTPATLDTWTSALAQGRVNVSFPRFVFESGGVMNDTLRDLGMKLALSDSADFSGMLGGDVGPRISLSQVVHRTWVSVDERGTEAAAATGAVMQTTSLQLGPVTDFKVDRPFVFFIREGQRDAKDTGRILFAGRVVSPKAS